MSLQIFARLLRPLEMKLANLVSRAVVKVVDDSVKMQILQLRLGEDETRGEVEHFHPYGFTSVPKEGAEAVVLGVGGSRAHALAIVVGDRRYRIRNLESGEVAVYNDTGSKLVMKTNGDIEMTPHSGKLKIVGDVEATGDVKAGTISLKNHTHSGATLVISTPAGAGSASGSTGAAQ